MMGSPLPWLAVFSIYLTFVLHIGPRFMRDRKAFKLTNATRVYNIYQIVLCIYFILKGISHGFSFKYGWTCMNASQNPERLTSFEKEQFRTSWLFTMLRASEFFETAVFVLRKKQNQVSFLHIYHHIVVVCLTWIFMKYSGSFNDAFIPIINSIVHIAM